VTHQPIHAPAMKPREWGLLVGLSMLWGGSFFLSEGALQSLQPFTVVFCRVAIAAIAYLLYFHILAITGATNLLLVTFLIPISALLLGTMLLHELLTWNAIAGMVLIFVGLLAIDGRLFSSTCQSLSKEEKHMWNSLYV
jgi:drug/metabolite transporter (DMT)-like permease